MINFKSYLGRIKNFRSTFDLKLVEINNFIINVEKIYNEYIFQADI